MPNVVAVICSIPILAACAFPFLQNPQEEKPTLLEVWVEPGFTRLETALQIRHYPLLILQADGTVIAGFHPGGGPGAGSFRIRSGKLAADELAKITGSLGDLLPPEPSQEGPTIVDAGRVTITAHVGDQTVKRSFLTLEPSLPDVLTLPDLKGNARDALVRRIAFARLVDALRQEHTSAPYVPKVAEILVTRLDEPAADDGAVAAWPLESMDLGGLADRGSTSGGPQPERLDNGDVLQALATHVVSGRLYRQGDHVYRVTWWPRLR